MYFEDDCFADPALATVFVLNFQLGCEVFLQDRFQEARLPPKSAETWRACVAQLNSERVKTIAVIGTELHDRFTHLLSSSGVLLGQLVLVTQDPNVALLAKAHGLSVRRDPLAFGRDVLKRLGKGSELRKRISGNNA